MKSSSNLSIVSLLLCFQLGCWISHTEFKEPLTRQQLAGTWVAEWTNKSPREPTRPEIYQTAKETLQLNADGSYQHTFEGGQNYRYRGPIRSWTIELSDNHLFVVLNKMRDYSRGIADAEAVLFDELRLIVEGEDGSLLCFEDDDLNVCFARR